MDKQQTYYVVVSAVPGWGGYHLDIRTHGIFATSKEANALCCGKNKRATEREYFIRAVKMAGGRGDE